MKENSTNLCFSEYQDAQLHDGKGVFFFIKIKLIVPDLLHILQVVCLKGTQLNTKLNARQTYVYGWNVMSRRACS